MSDDIKELKTEVALPQEKAETPEEIKKKEPQNTVDTETQEDPNWRAFREARKKDRAEREAAEKRATEKEREALALKAAMESLLNKNNQPAQASYSSYGEQEETEDERIEKKVQAAIAAREADAERKRHEKEQIEYPQRLAKDYADFHQTISPENLDYLDFHYPEVSQVLNRLPDSYDKWASVYKNVKKFVPNSANARKDAIRAESNFNKPKSMSTTNITHTGETAGNNRITEERKAENWARMQARLKSVG